MTTDTTEITFEPDHRETIVCLVRDADDYRALHDMILIEREGESVLLEPGPWQPEKPIERILALGGFTGSRQGSSGAVTAPKDTAFVRLRGFTVAQASKAAEVQMTARLALAGLLGGFHPVVHGQSGFHRAAFAFEYVWNAAGCPPIRVYHPELVGGAAAAPTGAGGIALPAEQNVTLAAVRSLEGTRGPSSGGR